nr:YadA-like family protein [Atlantibacter subterranea]
MGANLAIGENAIAGDGSLYTSATNPANTQAGGSIALGTAAQAKGVHAVAIGLDSKAAGNWSAALGPHAIATGSSSVALGDYTNSTGWSSSAIGAYANASSEGSVALGYLSSAVGNSGIAVGTNSKANSTNSVSIGNASSVSAVDGVAIGSFSNSSRGAGSAGYAPSEASSAQKAAIAATTSTRGAVDIGSRQITSVAAGTMDNDAVNVAQLKSVEGLATSGWNVTDAAGNTANIGPNGKVTFKGDTNIAVAQAGATDAGVVNVQLNKNLDLTATGSVTTGNSKLDNSGLVITGGPSVTTAGVNAGGKKITNVAPGTISSTSTDAINGSQLKDLADTPLNFAGNTGSTAKVLGSTMTIKGGKTTAGTYSDKNMNTVVDASGNLNIQMADNPVFTSVVATDGTNTTTMAANGLTVTGGPSVTTTGINAGGKKITNVAPGTISSTSMDAINGSQLKDLADTPLNFAGNTGTTAKVLGSTMTIKGGKTTAGTYSDKNMNTVVDASGNLNIQMADNPVFNTIIATDGTNTTTVAADGVTVAGGPSMTTGGINGGGKKARNIAAGDISSTSMDAINGSQLWETNENVTNITNTVNHFAGDQSDSYTEINGRGIRYVRTNDKGLPVLDAFANGQGSTAVGYNARSKGLNSLALGRDAQSINNGDVALGSGSVTDVAVATAGVKINDKDYAFAGVNPLSTVSVGSVGKERTITNVAAGRILADSTDAINGSQLFATNSAIDTLDKGAVKYDVIINADGSKTVNYNSVTLGGDTYDNSTHTGGTTITNVAYGVEGDDAVNVDQLEETVEAAKTRYYSVNDNGVIGANYYNDGATGVNALAAGVGASATGSGSIAMGSAAKAAAGRDAIALGTNATVDVPVWTSGIAIGPNAQTKIAFGVSMGENASVTVADGQPAADGGVAIGHNAKSLNSRFAENGSTTSTAVGNGAEADAGSSSFGEWARAHSLMGTAIGSGTTVNGDRSTAVGATASTDAADATALGYGAKANIAGGVALGTGSVAKTAADKAGYLPEGISEAAALAINATTSTLGAVSVGDAETGKFRQITGVAAGTEDSDAVNVAQLSALSQKTTVLDDRAVKYDEIVNPDGSKTVNYNNVTMGGDTYDNSTHIGGTTITNVADGKAPSDAVNFSQLTETNNNVTNITNTVNHFAGDQTEDYTIINGRGIRYVRTNDADLPLLDAFANGQGSTAVGYNARSKGLNSLALGRDAQSLNDGDVALGSGSVTDVAVATASVKINDKDYAFAGVNPLSTVSVGSLGNERTITNVAAGRILADSTDAINGSQLFATNSAIDTLDKGAVKYDVIINADGSKTVNYNSVTMGGDTYNNETHIGGTTITNVADGVAPSDAVNFSQLTETNNTINNIYTTGTKYFHANSTGDDSQAVGLDSVAIGMGAVSNHANDIALGAGSVTEAAVGTSSVTINGLGYHFAGVDPLSTVSVGSRGKERTITNVAAGRITSDSTDAINGSQLYATNSAIEVLDKGSVKYDVNVDGSVNYNSVTMGGDTYNSITKTGGTRIKNVAYGIDMGDAVNVQQLTDATTNIYNNGTKYFHATSEKADSVATGMDSIAVGPNAQSLGNGSIAMGDEAKSTGAGSAAIGQGAQTLGDNSVAMGTGAIANNANDVALGAGSVTQAAVATTSVTINGDTYAVAGNNPTSTVSVGSEGNERTITNVAAGRITADSTDAVNGSELYATNQSIEKISGDVYNLDQGSVKYETNVDGSVNYNKVIMGGDTYDNSTHTGGTTITNVANGVDPSDAVNKYQLDQVDQHVTNISNGTDGMFQVNNTSDLPKPTPTGKDSTAGGAGAIASGDYSTSIGANSKSTHNNSVALGYNSVTDRDNSVSMGSAGNERQVTNVAAGTADTDAANVGQLKQGVNNSYQYTNKKFNDLKNMVDDQKDKLSAGIAGAMATAGLPQPYQPGASMVGLAGGTYQGESAIALGVSTISDNGKWVTKIAGTTNSQGDVGAAVGVGYQF